jgi:thiol-disulfide isomerase/thioredoxin
MARKRKGAHSPPKPPPRAQPQEPHKRPHRPLRKPVRRTTVWLPAAATIGGIALLVVIFLAIRYLNTPTATPPAQNPEAAGVLATISGLSASELEQVGMGSAKDTIKPITGAALTGAAGKPLVFYYGAEYCPYCAAERWPIIIALSRFGTFSRVGLTTSSSTDVYPDTATFAFHGATYTSQYIELQAVETTDRNQKPLDSPTSAQLALVNSYDSGGYIPFVDFGNRYAFNGATYVQDPLQGLNWQEIAADLQNPGSPQAQGILGSANLITAVVCKLTSDQPASVCSGAAIKSIQAHL